MKQPTFWDEYSEVILLYLPMGEWSTTVDIARRTSLDINQVRRVMDRHAKEGRVGKVQRRFWNGMHYATRNFYILRD